MSTREVCPRHAAHPLRASRKSDAGDERATLCRWQPATVSHEQAQLSAAPNRPLGILPLEQIRQRQATPPLLLREHLRQSSQRFGVRGHQAARVADPAVSCVSHGGAGECVSSSIPGRIIRRGLLESAGLAGMGGPRSTTACATGVPLAPLLSSVVPTALSAPAFSAIRLSFASVQTVEAGSYARPGNPPIARSRTPSGPGRILRRAVGPIRMMWSASSLYGWPSTCTSAEPRSAM